MMHLQEPPYEVERLINDDNYSFEMLPLFQNHLDKLSDFEKKVNYFIRITILMGIDPPMLDIGSKVIERNGQKIHWGLKCSNDDEKAILHRLYFECFYRTSRTHFLDKPRHEYYKLFMAYLSLDRNERYAKLQLDWVTKEILDLQQLINDWIIANPDKYTPEIKNVFGNC